MSRFHRVEGLDDLPSDKWFRLAERLAFYEGAVRLTVQHDQEEIENAEENVTKADAIAKSMKARAAQYEGKGNPAAAAEVNSLKSILSDPEALARVRELATIAREGGEPNA